VDLQNVQKLLLRAVALCYATLQLHSLSFVHLLGQEVPQGDQLLPHGLGVLEHYVDGLHVLDVVDILNIFYI
jgi:hypothetical protein